MANDGEDFLHKFTEKQLDAYSALVKFYGLPPEEANIFVLKGYAGTGKTTLMKQVCYDFKKSLADLVFTAPTNKAAKVIRKMLCDYTVEVTTIYSLLGIMMKQTGEQVVLNYPENPVDLSCYWIVFVDEAGMINKQLLNYMLSNYPDVKFVFVGDPAQLPPVNEDISPVWKLKTQHCAELTEVMRFDNQLLTLATSVRQRIMESNYTPLNIKSDHDKTEGVWKLMGSKFNHRIEMAARRGLFTRVDHTKVIAWRNKTVDSYNEMIRNIIYDNPDRFMVGDRIMVAEPITLDNHIIASIDEEGTITQVGYTTNYYYPQLKSYKLVMARDDGRPLDINVIHEDSEGDLQHLLNSLANEAKRDRKLWYKFWQLRNTFHKVRYGYAITAHRSQGSTYKNVFVDQTDVMSNSNTSEALRCLYVAFTRPTKRLLIR